MLRGLPGVPERVDDQTAVLATATPEALLRLLLLPLDGELSGLEVGAAPFEETFLHLVAEAARE